MAKIVVVFCFCAKDFYLAAYLHLNMGFLDIVLGIILAYGCIRGLFNGFFVEVASFFSLLLGLYIAIKFSFFTAEILSDWFSWNPKNIAIWAFIITFILVVLGVSLLGKFFTSIASLASLGLVNKIAGAIFGVLKTCVILSFVLTLFAKINSSNVIAKQETLDSSLFYNPILKISETVYPIFQEWFDALKNEPATT